MSLGPNILDAQYEMVAEYVGRGYARFRSDSNRLANGYRVPVDPAFER